MAKFQIFDAPAQPENRLLQFQLQALSESIAWLESRGVEVERFDSSKNTHILKENPAIENLMEHSGATALPVIVLDGKIVLVGRYPSRNELSAWAKLQHPLFTFDGSGGCSGPNCG